MIKHKKNFINKNFFINNKIFFNIKQALKIEVYIFKACFILV